jgi:hypothetical protein
MSSPVISPASEDVPDGRRGGDHGLVRRLLMCLPPGRPSPGLASPVVNDTRGPSGPGAGYLRPARFPRPSPVVRFPATGRRGDDVLAYFTHRASNGPTEAINDRLEALRRNALGFRNLINYRIRSLLHCGALAL